MQHQAVQGPVSRRIAAAVLGVGALLIHTALAQQAPAGRTEGDEQLSEIVVTGSVIRRLDAETPSPVQTISAEQMKESGYTNVSDVLRTLAANGQGALSQSFGQAFAVGGSGIALRGLTVGDTLVLIDGQRMTSYPLSDDNQRSFTDISAIPFNAVDHIEVLKDGASAIYGADAIAGVVNVILKKSYTGTEITAEGGVSQHGDGWKEHLAGITGIGDLDNDGWNAYVAIDWHHDDQIRADARSGGFTNLDWSNYPGGLNTTPGVNGNPYQGGGYPNSVTGYLLNPALANPTNDPTTFAYLPGCNATALQLNQCTYRISQLQIQPATEQTNVLAKVTKALPHDWKIDLSASIFNSKAEQITYNYQTTDYGNGGIVNVPFGPGVAPNVVAYPIITVPATYPGNPYGAAAPLIYNIRELGVPETTSDTNTYRVAMNFGGSIGGNWRLDGQLGSSYSRMQLDIYGNLEPAQFQNALNNGYIIGSAANSALATQLFAPPADSNPSSTLYLADLHADNNKLLNLPQAQVGVALGAQFFRKVIDATAPAAIVSGVQEGDPVYAIGSQNDSAAYAEADATLFKRLELDAAVRYDNYNNGVGGSTTPKFSVKYKPFDMLALRGTWGKGFRAPSPAEGGQSGELFGAGQIPDPILCPNPANKTAAGNFPSQCAVSLTGYQVAGTNLQPVKSTNVTGGFVFEPVKQFSVSADYYSIKVSNDIISQFEAGGLSDYTSLVRGPAANLPFCTANGVCTGTATTPVGLAAFASYPYVNAGETRTTGFDVDMQTKWDLGVAGSLAGEINYTHIILYNETFAGTTYDLAGTHGPSGISGDTGNPKDKLVATLTYKLQAFTLTGTLNYTSHFSITDPSAGYETCADALNDSGTSAYGPRFIINTPDVPAGTSQLCTVHHFTTVNMYAQYDFGNHLSVHGSIVNLFNAQAPIDAQTYGGGGQLSYDGAMHQDGAVGRFFILGATARF
jgi:iron complex outermembrane receptor protein